MANTVDTIDTGDTVDVVDTVVAVEPVPEDRLARWSIGAEWPLTAAAAIFFVAYAWPILDPGIPRTLHRAFHMVDLATWIVFAVDYVIRLVLVRRRAHYFFHHLLDLAVVALPIFRPLRLLRLVLLLKVLNRRATDSFRGKIVLYVSGSTLILVLCAALAVLDAERGHPNSNINDFGDAIWWAFTTISTVGYGDRYPVTFEGRCVAIGLMVGGVALLGVVTATLASWLVDQVRLEDDAANDHELNMLRAEVRDMHSELSALRSFLGDVALPRPETAVAEDRRALIVD